MHLTRTLRALTPAYACTDAECPFRGEAELPGLLTEVAKHVRDTSHEVDVTEKAAVRYGPPGKRKQAPG